MTKFFYIIIFLLIGSTSFGQTLNNEPRVWNVRIFGAPGDGKIIAGGITATGTTFTATSSVFVPSDVGKVIKIDSAAANHLDQIDTIATYISATQVTVRRAAAFTVSNATTSYGTDCSVGIQAATDAAYAAGGGVVWFPIGIYICNDTPRTFIDGFNPNSQFYIHYRVDPGAIAGNTEITMVWEGEQSPDFAGSVPLYDNVEPMNGAILYSWCKSTGTAFTSILATGSVSGGAGAFSAVDMKVRNMGFRVVESASSGGPTLSGLNLGNFYTAEITGVSVAIDVAAIRSIQPTNNVFGINMLASGSGTLNYCDRDLVVGFKYGYMFGEHFHGVNIDAFMCQYGLCPGGADHSSHIDRAGIYWCNNYLASIQSYIIALSAHTISIDNLNIEVDTASANWWKLSKILYDPSNFLSGDCYYHIILRGQHALNNTLYSANGGTNYTIGPAEDGVMLQRDNFFYGTNRYLGTNVTSTTGNSEFQFKANGVLKWQIGTNATVATNDFDFYIFDHKNAKIKFQVDTNSIIYFPTTLTALSIDTTNYKVAVINKTTGRFESMFWPTGGGGGSQSWDGTLTVGNSTSQLPNITGFATTRATLNMGTTGRAQDLDQGDFFFGENLTYNGGYKYINNGYGSQLYFFNSGSNAAIVAQTTNLSGLAGNAATLRVGFQVDGSSNGATVVLGGNQTDYTGVGTGGTILVDNSNVTPITNNSVNLGSTTKFFSNVYGSTLNAIFDATHNTTFATNSSGYLTVTPSGAGATSFFAGSVNPVTTNGESLGASSFVWNSVVVDNIVTPAFISSSASVDLNSVFAGIFIFTGSSTGAWSMVNGITGTHYLFKNRGSTNVVISRSGSDQFYNTAATNSISLLAGQAMEVVFDGTYWLVLYQL